MSMEYRIKAPRNGFASRDPEHIRRWSDAGLAGRRRLRDAKQPAVTVTLPMPAIQGTALRCMHHLRGPARDAYDLKRREKLQRDLVSGWAVRRHRAQVGLAAINRRALHRVWLHAPDTPGSTLTLEPRDETTR